MSTDTEAKHEFQAEVRQLLDIVINSLYTDKEIFVRELVSNASDALEKLRHLQLTEREVFDDKLDLEISITTDETAKTITIADHGIGLTRDEMVENLGTIAHSGSKAFIEAMKNDGDKAGANVIGKFGVGFYSAFMVAERVKVYSHSWQGDAEHLCWTSDGQTGYEIEVAEGQRRGCKVVIELKDDAEEFAKGDRIKEVLEKYSNFVSFPILLNGDRINKVEALWLKNKSDVLRRGVQRVLQVHRERLRRTADADALQCRCAAHDQRTALRAKGESGAVRVRPDGARRRPLLPEGAHRRCAERAAPRVVALPPRRDR